MKLEIATLIEGSETPAGDGVTGSLRCVLILPDGSSRSAVLKRGPIEEVAAECFSALLLRAWGLTVPDPYLVIVENSTLAFASVDVGYPNLKQRMGISMLPDGPAKKAAEWVACEMVAQMKSTPLALAADEAIGNIDRNLGNILWDGAEEAWIDHAKSLGLDKDSPDLNKLAVMAMLARKGNEISRTAVVLSQALNRGVVQEAHDVTESNTGYAGAAPFVATRISDLAMRVLSRFPAPADLFG